MGVWNMIHIDYYENENFFPDESFAWWKDRFAVRMMV